MRIQHILYSGLGGHGNVFFSSVQADEQRQFTYEAVFCGVESVRNDYVQKCKTLSIPWKYIKKRKKLDVSFNRELMLAIKNSDASVIFLHGSRFILLAKIAAAACKTKKKIIIRETQANHLKTRFEWIWLIAAFLFADKIIFLTESYNEEIRKKFKWLYRKQKVSIINNGVDLTVFKPAEKAVSTPFVIGMQSRIVPIKDHSTLLKAFAILLAENPNVDLLLKIAGDGELCDTLQQLAVDLQIDNRVQFVGMLNETDLVKFLQSLDIYTHASLGETMSTSVMQAMACNLPIVASDVAGINNMIIHNHTGLLVPVKDPAAMANAIYSLITSPEKAAALRSAAFNFAISNYSNKTMFAKYQVLFKASVKNNR